MIGPVNETNPDERLALLVPRKQPLWKRIIPFLIAGGILSYLFYHIDTRLFFDALTGAKISLYLPLFLVFILASFFLDTQNLAAVLKNFNHTAPFRDVLGIRGVTYLLMTIDYSLGLGALIYYLKHDLAIPVMRSASLMLFFNTITQITLVFMAVIGLLLITPTSLILNHFLMVSLGFLGLTMVFIAVLKKLPSRGYMLKVKNLNLLKVFHEASWGSYCVLIFWRSIYYALFVFFFYASVRAFHMSIPLVDLIAYVPIILLVISLPITPCGFGTAQAAMIYLLKDYGTVDTIMAFGLTYSTSIIVFRSLIGLFFTKNIVGLAHDKPGT